ncbi:hypothetical protein AWJ20_3739 [Sugiyamaella lignohabitans]|uniref:Uncharacterized protein n=1 Tax=Sugiyamaella lignohabitans TaxID=796027 RepID=A0A167BXF7_9ASCO|nr:uncharacterized protein AWJ20_3739 [Sugiyamaella lignohabitans]ANB10945.1 hypothetical protein AWJ20_3739 [Sugiyamaella lignohabitans]
MMADFSGCHFTFPAVVLNLGESASSGTGIVISTLLAFDRFLNCARALTMISIRDEEKLVTRQSTRISGLTLVFRRYDMSSNSPSGGINEIVRSFSNRDRRTHWWNLTSSISMTFPDEPPPEDDPMLCPVVLD